MKQKLYFFVARYFQFWAKIVLKKWNPIIIAIVGSAGKTSTLYLLEKVLQDKKVKISHKTNAASAIPLNILGLKQTTFSPLEWLKLMIIAPFKINKKYDEQFYLCEMDSDRSNEMYIHTRLIKPDITLWTSSYAAHTQGFKGKTEEEILRAMAFDIGWAVEENKKVVLANAESDLIKDQLKRTANPINLVSLENKNNAALTLSEYKINLAGTKVSFRLNISEFAKIYKQFNSNFNEANFPLIITLNFPLCLIGKVGTYGIGMTVLVGLLFNIPIAQIETNLRSYKIPAGRMNIFSGIKTTTIIDSSYNSGREALIDAINTLKILAKDKSIAVLGDMRELGNLSQKEHEKIAQELISQKIRRIILIGPDMSSFVWPRLIEAGYLENRTVFKTLDPDWAAQLLKSEGFLRQGEVILIKGSQNTLFLEGIVEQILANKNDLKELCRRGKMWQEKRTRIYK